MVPSGFVAFLRLSTPRPLFYCKQCSSTKGPAMLKDNDSLGDPQDMVKAHSRSTGHHPVLIGGGGLHLVHAKAWNCLWCLDGTYVATKTGVEICACVEERLTRARTPAKSPARPRRAPQSSLTDKKRTQ
jgi:hypothetical protein